MMMMHNNKIMRDVWWWNDLIWWCSILRWCACITCHDALWRRVYKDTTLVNINDDECIKANVCMLLRVMCEWWKELHHKHDLKMKTMGTSCILCVHIHRDTFLFMMICTDAYTMMMMMVMHRMTLRGLLTSERRNGQLAWLWWV